MKLSHPAADGHGHKLMAMSDRHAVVNTWSSVINRLLRFPTGTATRRKRIAEHDRRMSFPRQRNFPANIIGFAPVDGRISARRDAIASGPRTPASYLRSSGNAALA